MARADRSAHRHAPTSRLLAGQVTYQLRLLVRSPIGAFATLVIPLMVLVAVNLLYTGTRLSTRGNVAFAQFFTPAMVAFAVVNACYMHVITSTTLAREEGILKRIRCTPLPPAVYMAGRLLSAGLVAFASAIVVVAVSVWLYDFTIVWAAVPAALLSLALALFCFSALGLAVTVLVPAADSALPIAWGTILPLCFVSDVFQPIDNAPAWLRVTASAFPLRPFADDLESAFNPVTGNASVHWGHLAVLAGWGLAATAFALLTFRWEPGGRGRERAGRRSATFALGRMHAIFETRGESRRPAAGDERGKAASARTAAARPRARTTSARPTLAEEVIEGPAPCEDSSVPPEQVPDHDRDNPTDVAMAEAGRQRSAARSVTGPPTPGPSAASRV